MTPAVCRVLYFAGHPAGPEEPESVSEAEHTRPARGCQPQNDGLECETDGARGGNGDCKAERGDCRGGSGGEGDSRKRVYKNPPVKAMVRGEFLTV